MIVADTSAIIAIVFAEPEREAFVDVIRRAERVLVDDLLRLPKFELIPPGIAEMDAAYAAFVAFGQGSGHPAALNFGDLFGYALAKVRGLPLLYKGVEFSETDIASAAP